MSDEDRDEPEIYYVPGAENHWKSRHNVIVLDSRLTDYPKAHELIKEHELAHADNTSALAFLLLELKTDLRFYLADGEQIREAREYFDERPNPHGLSLRTRVGYGLVNVLREFWTIPMKAIAVVLLPLREWS